MFSLQENSLLIADPFLKEEPFSRAVIYLCEHNKKGSFGLVLNKKFEFALHELIEGVTNLHIEVFVGGPVGTDTIHFLHQYPEQIPGGKMMSDNLYWGGDFKKTLAFIDQHPVDSSKIKFFIGYSGWSQGQLENELKEKSWLIAPPNPKIIFSGIEDKVWKAGIDLLDDDFKQLKNYPIDPQLN